MTFAIRAGILGELNTEFGLNDTQLGWVNSMAFLGFPVAMIIGGLLYNSIGPRKLMWVAFLGHLLGLVLTIFAGGFWGLIISTFFIGFANGSVEAACNPMIVDMYPKDKTTMLNKFHVWFPGGIVIGALVSTFMTGQAMGWQLQIAVMLIPTLIYGFLIFGQEFPETKELKSDTKANLAAIFKSPLFWFMAICMTLTATSELGTQQWVQKILGNAGANAMLILALWSGIMAVGRFFAGPVVHKFNPAGVLFGSAIISTLGIFLLLNTSGMMVYFATAIFAIGLTYFWPTMIGFVGEYLPDTGALGMSLIGGAGMFALTIWNPIIGRWLDTARESALTSGMNKEAADTAAGIATLDNLAFFPAILIFAFGGLYFYMRKRETT
jgi:MFS family permease